MVERTKPAGLSHTVDPAHHNRGAGLDQMRRAPSYDAYRSRNARRRCNPTHSSRAAVHSSGGSEPVSYVLDNYLKNFLCIYSITGRRQVRVKIIFFIVVWYEGWVAFQLRRDSAR